MIRTPQSTYRLQLHKDFTFEDATNAAAYIKELGITHVYSSPYLQAAPGSMHGYDVVDHQRVNEELGGIDGHTAFCKRLRELGLGQVLDIVPNHMSLGEQNRPWWDVLENGFGSRYAGFFDIDWNSPEARLRDKVLIPILSGPYGKVLEAHEIKVGRKGSVFQVEAAGQQLPVSPLSLPAILFKASEYAKNDTLSFLAASFARLPTPTAIDRKAILARHRDKTVLEQLLTRLCSEADGVCTAIDRATAELNENVDALDNFLNEQNYRLAYWKAADQQLGYRRFFDVNTLIGLRMERQFVFDESHTLILQWLKDGVLDGVRVDHPDGLRNPREYFERLRDHAPDAWIVGEKILAREEYLREEWPIQGTSGYDFLNMVSGLFVNAPGLRRLGEIYQEFTGDQSIFAAASHAKKLDVEQETLASDVNRLTEIFVEICEHNRQQRDFNRSEIRRAIREVAASFSVYRSYVIPALSEITAEDRKIVTGAVAMAKGARLDIDESLFDFIHDVLTLKITGLNEEEFVLRFQQFTSPVMAKGVEDTVFYCFNRLISLNEVGGNPKMEGVSISEFHEYNSRMQRNHPDTLLTLSTHDTKRSDDVRSRLQVLSEIPEAFGAQVKDWSQNLAALKTGQWPDAGTEWFLYQTVVGAWPINSDRLTEYMLKAMREAKVHTSWTVHNEEYEKALSDFINAMLQNQWFITSVESFVSLIRESGWVNSLAQTVMKHTCPGVPDLYQGGELWDLSLVDPDNRRPVDYEVRGRMLEQLTSLDASAVLQQIGTGMPKLWVITKCLSLRWAHPEWFGAGATYEGLTVFGEKSENAVVYTRSGQSITIAPRLSLSLQQAWGDTHFVLPQGTWKNIFDGQTFSSGKVRLQDVLHGFPVGVLVPA